MLSFSICKQEYRHLSKLTSPLHWVLYWCQEWDVDRQGSSQCCAYVYILRHGTQQELTLPFGLCTSRYVQRRPDSFLDKELFPLLEDELFRTVSQLGLLCSTDYKQVWDCMQQNSHWKKWAGVAISIAEPQPQTKWAPGGVFYRTTNAGWKSIPNLDCRAALGGCE